MSTHLPPRDEIDVPLPAPTGPPVAPAAPRADEQAAPVAAPTFCRACGNQVDPRAFVCPACGVKQAGAAGSSGGVDTGIAVAASVITSPVIGMLLIRRFGLAAAYLVALIIGLTAFVVPGLLIYAGGIFHVYSAGKRRNAV